MDGYLTLLDSHIFIQLIVKMDVACEMKPKILSVALTPCIRPNKDMQESCRIPLTFLFFIESNEIFSQINKNTF